MRGRVLQGLHPRLVSTAPSGQWYSVASGAVHWSWQSGSVTADRLALFPQLVSRGRACSGLDVNIEHRGDQATERVGERADCPAE